MIVAFIPAKKNSARLIAKNKRLLKRKPLFQHSIDSAKDSKKIKKIFVSSNDDSILSLAKKLKCESIMRPNNLSKKNTPMNSVIKHFISYLEKKKIFAKSIVLLQPTSPFREKRIIDKLILKFLKLNKTLVSVKKENTKFLKGIISTKKKNFPIIQKFFNSNDQNLPRFFSPNGSIYIFDIKKFKIKNSIPINDLTIHEMFGKYNINIDTIKDLKYAKEKIKTK